MLSLSNIENILENFKVKTKVVEFSPISNGHINDTYKVTIEDNSSYILQKLNSSVFKNVDDLMKNKVAVSKSLESKIKPSIQFIESNNGNCFYEDESNCSWNLMTYISNSYTHDKPLNTNMSYEAGKLYGNFLVKTSTIDLKDIVITLPDFHSVRHRYNQFKTALNSTKRIVNDEIKNLIHQLEYHKDKMIAFSDKIENEDFKIRVTHNDAKLSNILFDKNQKGLTVIDLDTIMPGVVHYDFGDSIRSICTNTTEDDKDVSKATLNLDYFDAYCKGYLEECKTLLTDLEIEYLPVAPKLLTYLMAVRFFTDYLNGNIYYKVKYDSHNLDRSKNQFNLLNDMDKNLDKITSIVNSYC